MEAVIAVASLRKRYGEIAAVDGVSFDVQEGEIFGLIGPNGAGKTTTVECLQGLRRPDGGTMRVLGLDPLREPDELRRRIGSQLQEAALPDRLKVREALELFAAFARDPEDWEALLVQWGLEERRNAAFATLSGGERQRLFIALALVNRPRLVFLDEVTQGLDPQARRSAWDVIRAVRDQGATLVLVTHYMDEAEHLCDRVAMIDRGRIVTLDTPAALVAGLDSRVKVRFSTDADVSWLEALGEVTRVVRSGREVTVEGTGAVLAHVAAALVGRGIAPPDLRAELPTLEDVFLRLAGRRVED
jgi:ABC-2 type transport system ATP-binding protein